MASQGSVPPNTGSPTFSGKQGGTDSRRPRKERRKQLGSSSLTTVSSASNSSVAVVDLTKDCPTPNTRVSGPLTDRMRKDTIIFDIDAIIDAGCAKEKAMREIQHQYGLQRFSLSFLLHQYKAQTEVCRNRYTSLEEGAMVNRINCFFLTACGVSGVCVQFIEKFRDDYEKYQRKYLRPTPGTIEVMVRLRERGFLIAITAAGWLRSQKPLLKGLGVSDLIDVDFTSTRPEDAFIQAESWLKEGCKKPPYYIGYAKSDFKWSSVGDSPWMWSTLWYHPEVQSGTYIEATDGVNRAPTIAHMKEVLRRIGCVDRTFEPNVTYANPGVMSVGDIGMDIVTRPRVNFNMSKADVSFVMGSIYLLLGDVSEKRYLASMKILADMMWRIAKIDTRIDMRKFNILLPGEAAVDAVDRQLCDPARVHCSHHEGNTGDSLCLVYWYMVFVEPETNSLVKNLALSCQYVCEALMEEKVDKALAWLQSMLFQMAAKGNCLASTHCVLGIGNPLRR